MEQEGKPRPQLREARKAKSMSQQEVAAHLNVDDDTVSKWELGRSTPQPYHARALCELFEKSLEELDLRCTEVTVAKQRVAAASAAADERLSSPFALSVRLMTCLLRWPRYHVTQDDLATLEMLICLEIESETTMSQPESDLNRREALLLLASLPISMFGLSDLRAAPSIEAPDLLPMCASGIAACWKLSKGTELKEAQEAISSYLPTLSALTRNPRHRKSAAFLAAQGYLLKATLAWHLEDLTHAATYAKQAKHFADMAENDTLQVDALRRLAMTYHYGNQWDMALTTIQEAMNITEHRPVPDIVTRFVILSLSVHLGYAGNIDQSEEEYGRAEQLYEAEASDSLAQMLGYGGKHTLVLWGGVSLAQRGLINDAIDLYTLAIDPNDPTVTKMPIFSERSRVEIVNNYAIASLKTPEKDMELTLKLLTAGAKGATQLQSKQRSNEILATYNRAESVWSGERRIADLRPLVLGWKQEK